jgi:hypothetical protein
MACGEGCSAAWTRGGGQGWSTWGEAASLMARAARGSWRIVSAAVKMRTRGKIQPRNAESARKRTLGGAAAVDGGRCGGAAVRRARAYVPTPAIFPHSHLRLRRCERPVVRPRAAVARLGRARAPRPPPVPLPAPFRATLVSPPLLLGWRGCQGPLARIVPFEGGKDRGRRRLGSRQGAWQLVLPQRRKAQGAAGAAAGRAPLLLALLKHGREQSDGHRQRREQPGGALGWERRRRRWGSGSGRRRRRRCRRELLQAAAQEEERGARSEERGARSEEREGAMSVASGKARAPRAMKG